MRCRVSGAAGKKHAKISCQTRPVFGALKRIARRKDGIFILNPLNLLVNQDKIIAGTYAVLFAAITICAGLFFLRMHRELVALRAQESANERRIAEATTRLQEQEKYLDQLRHDPALVERIIRRKLGYAKPDEFVFRFEE